jgi:hypothetical protein
VGEVTRFEPYHVEQSWDEGFDQGVEFACMIMVNHSLRFGDNPDIRNALIELAELIRTGGIK